MSIDILQLITNDTDYIAKHNTNYGVIKAAVDLLQMQMSSVTSVSGVSVPLGLMEIFDRTGLVGSGSFDFNEGVKTGPSYYLEVAAGAWWNGAEWCQKLSATNISLASYNTGTYYLNIDSTGTPTIAQSATAGRTARQFHWDATTHTVSAKALYTGAAILFDGDDYADMLDSAARGLTYGKVADRLEDIEKLLAEFTNYYGQDLAQTTGLEFYYLAGKVRNDSTVTDTPAGHLTLTASTTNYIEVDPATGVVSANTTGFTSGLIPLFQVATGASAITSVTDKRTWAVAGTGGGGGGGHTQGTDLGTTSDTFTLDTDATGTPTGRVQLQVENGDNPNAALAYNRDTGKWEYSTDGGSTWRELNDPNLDLGAQELTKYTPREDPDLVLEELGRGSSSDYEDLDLSGFITAPFGATAVVLRVFFWDSAQGEMVNVLFKKKDAAGSPALAWTVWAGAQDPATLVIPLSDAGALQYWVNASGTTSANLRVFLQGYYERVTGVGTQERTCSQTGIAVPAGGNITLNLTGECNRGLAHYLKLEETGGLVSGVYDIEFYRYDTFTGLLYKATDIDPQGAAYEDFVPWWIADGDNTSELHVKLSNHDTGNQATFSLDLVYEKFA